MSDTNNTYIIYTDGACRNNPGPGGWGVVLEKNDRAWDVPLEGNGAQKELWGGEVHTTNNRMELTAVIRALEATETASTVSIYTDSRYVQQGMTQWILKWRRNGWRSADGAPVKNQDLWLKLEECVRERVVKWFWIKGHYGHPGNERADRLANRGLEETLSSAPKNAR